MTKLKKCQKSPRTSNMTSKGKNHKYQPQSPIVTYEDANENKNSEKILSDTDSPRQQSNKTVSERESAHHQTSFNSQPQLNKHQLKYMFTTFFEEAIQEYISTTSDLDTPFQCKLKENKKNNTRYESETESSYQTEPPKVHKCGLLIGQSSRNRIKEKINAGNTSTYLRTQYVSSTSHKRAEAIKLQHAMKEDIRNSLAASTQNQYSNKWKEFKRYYHSSHGHSHYLANKSHLALYVTYLRHIKDQKAAAIRSHLSAIKFYFNMKNVSPPTSSFQIKALLKNYDRQDSVSSRNRQRLPITRNILSRMIKVVPHITDTSYESTMVQALFSLMYWALLRVSEVTHSKDNKHNLQLSNISLNKSDSKLRIDFTSFKFSKGIVPAQLTKRHSTSCPVRLFTSHHTHYPKENGPAFVHKNGKPLSRLYVKRKISESLQAISKDPSIFDTHSFRIGRATDMFLEGYSDTQIQLAGRWKSTAFKKYIKPRLVRL